MLKIMLARCINAYSLASCGSSTKRGRSLKKKPGKLIAAAPSKGRSPECPESWTSVLLLLRVLRKRQRAVAQRSPLKKKDSSSCRHCFPDFSRAELEWLNPLSVAWSPFTDAGFRSFKDRVKLREGRRAFFVGLPSVLHRSCDSDLWVRFSCDFVNMSVKQHICCGKEALMMLRRWSFSFFFFCRLPNPPLTHRRNLCVRRCPFSPFFCRVPNRRQPTCSKKNISPQWNEFMCESSDREAIELGGAGEGTKRQCYVAVSHLIQLWQSDIVAVFFPALFPSCWTPSCCLTWVTILPFDINLASYSMLLFASSTMRNFSP